MKSQTKKLITLGCVAGGLVIILITLLLLRTNTVIADWVTMHISMWWVYFIGHINSAIPFSVFELFVVLAVIFCIIFIILLIRLIVKRNFFVLFKNLLIFAIIIVFSSGFYTLTAGFTYYRSPISVPQTTKNYDNSMAIDAAQFFLDDYNNLAGKLERDDSGNVISPYTIKELSSKIAQEYDKFDSDYLFKYSPRVKPIINSWFMTMTSITGITFVPFGEPNINANTPPSDIPQVMAHEMSHAKGVMREGDCNFVACYILLNSTDDYLRYCGYFSCFGSVLSAVDAGEKTAENYDALKKSIDAKIIKEYKNASEFWSSRAQRQDFLGALTRTLNKVSSFFNNLYLKINGALNGTGSYGDSATDGDIADSGNTDEDGDVIYIVTRTSMQKMFYGIYETKVK